MEKVILIMGGPGSGKTTKAREIASQYKPEEVVQLLPTKISPFSFRQCTPETKLIVVDELNDVKAVENYIIAASSPLEVNKRGEYPFIISPKFVIVCSSMITHAQHFNIGASFIRRCEIVSCKYNTQLYAQP